MKRLSLLLATAMIFTTAAFADDFGVNIGIGLGFLSISDTVQSVASEWQGSSLYIGSQTYEASYLLGGGNLSVDLTSFLNVRAGLWMDLGASNDSGQGVRKYSGEAGRNLILDDLGASLKWPLHVTEYMTFSPKAGIDKLSYIGGGAGGTIHPSGDEKEAVSPLLVTVGFDLDDRFGDWIMRLPLDLSFAPDGKFSDQHYKDQGVPFTTNFRLELLRHL
jgi:hypothetical protein